jgi:starch synthase
MHVVLIAAEATPLAKVGGLADVVHSLAAALQELGVQVTMILPGYRSTASLELRRLPVSDLTVQIGAHHEPVVVREGTLPGTSVRLLVLDHRQFFDREGVYADPRTGEPYADNARRYAYLCRAATHALAALGQPVDVLHLNDHHTALAVAFARHDESIRGFFARSGIVFSVHNLGYQGIHEFDEVAGLGFPQTWMRPGGPLEFWGKANSMKLALELSDVITTVSPGYAREIQESEEYGFGLQGVLQQRRESLVGILNGIDLDTWNPQSDAAIAARYDVGNLAPKETCRNDLRQRLGLLQTDTPVFGVISRLASQKGIDLILEALPRLLQRRLQLVILGAGDPALEESLQRAARQAPDRVACRIGFDEDLAHQIEAGCDFFLMPSRYEPCGLNQMYSQRYGTPPIVRRTGGLADTVSEWNPARGTGTGFLFDEMRVDALLDAVDRADTAYRSPADLAQLRRNAMQADFSWERSARRYLEAYRASRQSAASAGKPAGALETPGGH